MYGTRATQRPFWNSHLKSLAKAYKVITFSLKGVCKAALQDAPTALFLTWYSTTIQNISRNCKHRKSKIVSDLKRSIYCSVTHVKLAIIWWFLFLSNCSYWDINWQEHEHIQHRTFSCILQKSMYDIHICWSSAAVAMLYIIQCNRIVQK